MSRSAILLVGGMGTRLHPLTLSMPKPMLPVAGVPFTEHQILKARDAGISEIVAKAMAASARRAGGRPPRLRGGVGCGGIRLGCRDGSHLDRGAHRAHRRRHRCGDHAVERAVAGVEVLLAIGHLEEAGAEDGHVDRAAGVGQRALREVHRAVLVDIHRRQMRPHARAIVN